MAAPNGPIATPADAPEEETELTILEQAFRGYVAIVYPVSPGNRCAVRATDAVLRHRDAYRSWYQVPVNAHCPKLQPETYDIWFLCSKRNIITCSLIREPRDLIEVPGL